MAIAARSGTSFLRMRFEGTWADDTHDIDEVLLETAGHDDRSTYLMLTNGQLLFSACLSLCVDYYAYWSLCLY